MGKKIRKKNKNFRKSDFFSAEKFAASTKIPLYRPVGGVGMHYYTLPKNNGLNRRFEKSKCFNTFYIYLTLCAWSQKKSLNLGS